MPAFTVNDFEGDNYEQKLEKAFAAFTPRQKARLEALKDRKALDLKEWPAIYLEKKEYFQWMHQSEELEQLHEDIQIHEARNKEERDSKKAANIQKGKEMAKVPGKRPSSVVGTPMESPPAKKVLGKEPYVVSIPDSSLHRCLHQPGLCCGGPCSGSCSGGSCSGGASGTTVARCHVCLSAMLYTM